MTEAAIISGSLVDVRNVGTHKSVKLTIHVPEEHATRVVAAFGWPTGVNPVSVAIARLDSSIQQPETLNAAVDRPRPVPPIPLPAGAAKERRRFSAQPYAQQAALRCNDPVFWAFLREMAPHAGANTHSKEEAATAVRIICCVDSRADIQPDTPAETFWLELEEWFSAWKAKERAMA
jgi:hypothetical protein